MPALYGLTTCDTCKKARQWLDDAGIAHTFSDYRNPPPSPQTLQHWATRRGGFATLINRASTTWRQLPDARKTPASDTEWMALLQDYPALIRRPVLVMADGSVHQGFSDTHYKSFFGANA